MHLVLSPLVIVIRCELSAEDLPGAVALSPLLTLGGKSDYLIVVTICSGALEKRMENLNAIEERRWREFVEVAERKPPVRPGNWE